MDKNGCLNPWRVHVLYTGSYTGINQPDKWKENYHPVRILAH